MMRKSDPIFFTFYSLEYRDKTMQCELQSDQKLNPFIFEQNSKLIIIKCLISATPNQALLDSSGELGLRRDEPGL